MTKNAIFPIFAYGEAIQVVNGWSFYNHFQDQMHIERKCSYYLQIYINKPEWKGPGHIHDLKSRRLLTQIIYLKS